MLKVTITKTAPHRDGLALSMTVEHTKAGWARVSTTVLVVDALSERDKQALTAALNHAAERSREYLEDDTEPLF